MPDLDGLAVVRDQLATRVLLLSAHTDGAIVFGALQEAAAGYLPKDAGRAEIVEAVLKVARGETVVPAGLANQIRLARSRAARRCQHANAMCCKGSHAGCRSPRWRPS